jgi:subtilisin family serine protease
MHRFTPGVLALTVLLACGTPSSAAETSPVGSMAQIRSNDSIPLATRAAEVLRLQPGDAEKIAGARPEAFQAVLGERMFSGELIVRTRDAARADAKRAASDRIAPITAVKSDFVDEFVVRVPVGMSEGELAGVLMATGDYEYAHPNWILFPAATTPNDPQFSQSWQHTRIQSTLAWDITQGSPDVIVAVCDSGVRTNHADLAAALVPGYNSATRVAEVDGGLVEDINGHGTFVAGCAAAIGNNATGVTGVGWNLKIMPIRVTNNTNGTASLFALTDGARWAANNGARAVNVSFTGADAQSNNAAARDVKNAGGLLFWASGNAGSGFGGVVPDLVIVGSTSSNDQRSSFSNYGAGLGVVAPGASVRSTNISGGYGNSSGTSFASPIAAGVGAMIFSANPALSPDDVQDVLYRSADDLGAPGFDNFYGHGRVNTFKAVTLAQDYTPRLPLPVAESFESESWLDLFENVSGAAGSVDDPDAPTGESALELTGTDAVQTLPLAGRTVSITDSVRIGVRTEGAEAGEALAVRYLDSSGAWQTLYTAPASGADTDYVVHEEVIPAGFRWHGVQVRLEAQGSEASDRWLVDSFEIGPRSVQGAPFAEPFDTGRVSPMRWANNTGATSALLGTDFVMQLPMGVSVETVAIPIISLASFEQYVYFYAAGDGVGEDDNLLVQYFTPITGWQTLGSVNGSSLDAGQTGFEFPIPFGALAASDFRVRFTSNTGGGIFFVDDVNVGTNRLPPANPGCSAADLAAPFGVLNFFDLSAYLGLFNAGDPAADLAAPFGTLNFFDLSAYLGVFNAGCP